MGNCSAPLSKGDRRSQRIEKECRDMYKKESAVIQLLLLGSGGSGKSTFFKQFVSAFADGFSDEERELYIPVIHENIIKSMKTLVEYSTLFSLSDPELDTAIRTQSKPSQQYFELNCDAKGLSLALSSHIDILWKDRGIQNTALQRSKYLLEDSTDYFMSRVLTISDPSYWPTDDDLFRARLRTTGIIESVFEQEGRVFKIIDVGGQKNERRKWIHCFSKVSAVLFVASLTGYAQLCSEYQQKIDLEEALEVFSATIVNAHLQDASFILFLNKKDLFEHRISVFPLSNFFKHYSGPNSYEKGIELISQKFRSIAEKRNRPLFIHTTCATDSENVKKVFMDVKTGIIDRTMNSVGLV